MISKMSEGPQTSETLISRNPKNDKEKDTVKIKKFETHLRWSRKCLRALRRLRREFQEILKNEKKIKTHLRWSRKCLRALRRLRREFQEILKNEKKIKTHLRWSRKCLRALRRLRREFQEILKNEKKFETHLRWSQTNCAKSVLYSEKYLHVWHLIG